MMKISQLSCLILSLSFLGVLLSSSLQAQPERWQLSCTYDMDIDFDVKTHRFTGKQTIVLDNNSPDDLEKVFYHLYFNAFQPGSMMDVRNQALPDSDPRVKGRIQKLKPNEIGYVKVTSLKHDGKDVPFEIVGTILEVALNESIEAGAKATFDMEFESQVPLQIRRSGRDSKEGISYSMTQWYPKMCNYDYQGWHANPYVGREFYGIWGDFDVTINIDKNYLVGATGYLQNPKEIGHGYEKGTVKRPSSDKLSWKFKADKVHDFAWAADPDYVHDIYTTDSGIDLHFIYEDEDNIRENWKNLQPVMAAVMEYLSDRFGEYPYKKYSFIQGGDGGMEYPMATLITGERQFSSLVGVSVHELVHSWYQMVLGTNEALYAWMDEGFTTYATTETMNWLRKEKMIPGEAKDNPHADDYAGYRNLAQSGVEESMTTHADHYNTNYAYGLASYVKGSVFVSQLGYIIGEDALARTMKSYYETWKFKHPNTNDFIRIAEKESGLELDWYKEYWVQSTHTIDYKVDKVEQGSKRKETVIKLSREGIMPMPVDVVVTDNKGKKTLYHIPMVLMRGEKEQEFDDMNFEVKPDWAWTNKEYEFSIDCPLKKIKKVEIDPSGRMADLNSDNNVWEK